MGSPGRDDDGSADAVIRTVCVFLVVAGWPARKVEQAVDYIAHRIASLSSGGSAVEIVSKDLSIAVRFGYRRDEWAELVRLLVGVPAGRRRSGRHGLLARVLLGDDVADLLSDTALVDVARRMAPVPDVREGR